MKKKIYCLKYILCFVLLPVFHVIEVSSTNVDQTDKTDRLTILQQLLNNVGKKVTENELKIELQSIALKYTEKAKKATNITANIIGEVLKINSTMKILDDAEAGYVNKKLKSYIKDEIKKEERLLPLKQKASRIAELEKELEKYSGQRIYNRQSQLQLFAGYSYEDVALECKRLEKAEETLKIEIEKTKVTYAEQEQRKKQLLLRVQTIADTITIVKDSVRKHLNNKMWDKYDDKIRLARHHKEKDILDEMDRLQSVKDKVSAYLQTLLDEENRIKRKEILVDSIYAATGGKLKKYDGGYKGANANYYYFELPDGERIMHGLFHLKRDSYPILIDGKFDKGKRTGTWTFRVPSYKLFVTYKKGKLQSTTCKSGENSPLLVALTFNSGEINGYAMKINQFSSDLSPVNIAFGNAKQTAKFPDDETNIRCSFDADGYPDGLWTKETTDNNRNRHRIQELYEHGVLKKVTHTDLSVTGEKTEISLNKIGYSLDIRVEDNFLSLSFPEVTKYLKTLFSHFEDDRLEIPGVVKYKMGNIQIAEEKKLPTEGTVYSQVESMPEFPGGDEACRKFIKDNMKKNLPLQSDRDFIVVKFTVNHDGSLTDIKATGNKILSEEAIRIVKAMPKWLPGMQNGETERVKTVLRINFNK